MSKTMSRLRLDNAANIYPASLAKHYSSLFRLRLTFTEKIDKAVLSQALGNISNRFPTLRCRLKAGGFWWYLVPVDSALEIYGSAPLKVFDFRDYGEHIYRVIADGNCLILDVFHALTDGSGGKTIILTLAAEYCRLRYGADIPCGGDILDPAQPCPEDEIKDSFITVFGGRKGKLEKDVKAYHIEGQDVGHDGLQDTRMVIDLESLRLVCREYGCTITEFLTACLLDSLQYVHSLDRNPLKRNIVKVSVPVDLRPVYGCRALRNFSTYINLGIDLSHKRYSLRGIIREVALRKKEGLLPQNMETKIAANVELEQNFIVGCIPLFIKKIIIDTICRNHGDKFISYTLSNLCKIELPEQMSCYISDIDFYLGRQRGTSGAASCVSYGGRLYLHLTRKIRSARLEERMEQLMKMHGIPCETSESILA